MQDEFAQYFAKIIRGWPPLVGVIVALYIIAAIFLGLIKGRKVAFGMLLIGYCLLLLHFTVFSGVAGPVVRYSLWPFSSYLVILKGNTSLIPQVLMNVVLFVPFGYLMKGVFQGCNWKLVAIIGVLISIAVELLQFILKKGDAEFDDVFHNTIGCLLGIMFFVLIHVGKRSTVNKLQANGKE